MYNFDQVTDRRNTNSVKWDECTHPDILPLWVADMDFATAPCVQQAIAQRAAHPCYGYTFPPKAYYQAIQNWFQSRHGWTIQTDQILYTIGVIPAIAAILKAWCQVGDNVVLLSPVYNCFYNLVRNAGCRNIDVPLHYSAATDATYGSPTLSYSIDWEALEQALSLEKTTTLLFCNPHNPVGRLWTDDELRRVATLCHRHGVLLISDEIHNELSRPGIGYCPMGRCLSAMPADTTPAYVVCASPSKSFNTAGLQNAFIVCPQPDLRRRIDRAINLNETCDVNPFGIDALIAAYTQGGEWLDALRTYLFDNYDHARQRLAQALPQLAVADLQATYLMWIDCRAICQRMGIDSTELCRRLTIDAHLWICAGVAYGDAGEGFVRINLACPRATLDEALTRFIDYVK